MDTFSGRFGYAESSPIVYDRASAPSFLKDFVRGLIKLYIIDVRLTHIWLADQMSEVPICKLNSSLSSGIIYEIQIADESRWRRLKWYFYYDCIEWAYCFISKNNASETRSFLDRINHFFKENGIGWQLVDGKIIIRGDEPFEQITSTAINLVSGQGKETTVGEMKEAILDLSRKPDPDLTGAMHHSMSALECLARDITGQPKLTLGKWISANSDKFPSPVGDAVNQLWGYASNNGRHNIEGNKPQFEEVELVVSLSALLITYLMRKKEK